MVRVFLTARFDTSVAAPSRDRVTPAPSPVAAVPDWPGRLAPAGVAGPFDSVPAAGVADSGPITFGMLSARSIVFLPPNSRRLCPNLR